jgi:hypothetical protein
VTIRKHASPDLGGNGVLFWAILCLAFAVRVVLAAGFRFAVSFDEAHYLRLAAGFTERGLPGLLHPYWPPGFPAVIALCRVPGFGFETAGRLVGILSGVAVVGFVYKTAEDLFGRREAAVSALLFAIYPSVAFDATAVMPESLFSALSLWGMRWGWQALLGKRSVFAAGAAGLAWGFAYLAKPEGVGFLLVFLAAAFAVLIAGGSRPVRPDRGRSGAGLTGQGGAGRGHSGPGRSRQFLSGKRLSRHGLNPRSRIRIPVIAILAAAGFLAAAMPYLGYLHGLTGRWTLSTKASVNQQLESAVYFKNEANPDPFFHLTSDNRMLPYDMAWHFGNLDELAAKPEGKNRVVAFDASQMAVKYARNFYRVVKNRLSEALGLVVLVLFATGLFGARPDRRRLLETAYLLAFAGFFWFVVIPMFHVNNRYFQPLIPVCFVWAGAGAAALAGWFGGGLRVLWPRNRIRSGRAGAVLSAAFVFAFGVIPETARLAGIRADDPAMWADPVEMKAAGRWLAQNAGPAAVIADVNKAVDFYAGQMDMRKGASFSYDPVDRNIAYARHRGCRYLVHSSRYRTWFPSMDPVFEKEGLPPGLTLVYASDVPAGVRTVIYRIDPADSAGVGGGAR